jgi:hypothetical protein
VRHPLAPQKMQQKRLPLAEWKIRVNDKYP